jgi:hypothetical protein
MFGLFKKRSPFPSAEELSSLAASASTEVREKWEYFHRTVHLKAEVPLAQKIDLFSQPLSQFFHTKYPQLLAGGSEIFWLTIFTAVLESRTHPTEEVNAAVEQLRGKYAGKA